MSYRPGPPPKDWPAVERELWRISQGLTELSSAESISSIFVNVQDYGATGDGVTDDTEAIQLAFDQDKNVIFPKGTYLLSDTINVATLDHPRNQSLFIATDQGTIISGSAGMAGKPLFKLEGSGSVQQFGNRFDGFRFELNGACGAIDFSKGCFTSYVTNCRIGDKSGTPDVFGIRVHNSFNIVIDNVQTVGLYGPAVKFLGRLADGGFSNLTNCEIRNSIFQNQFAQNGAYEVVNLIDIDLNVAADTLTIHNTALKADATGSHCIHIDGFVNQLRLTGLHIESSYTGIYHASGSTTYATIDGCLFTNVKRAFDWQSNGQIAWSNNRFLNGTGNIIFQTMNADVDILGTLTFNSGSYTPIVQNGTGRIRRTRQTVRLAAPTATNWSHEDNFCYYYTGGALSINLPETSEVGEGFRVSAIRRGGPVTFVPTASDRILYGRVTTAGQSVTFDTNSNYIELVSQNSIGGSQNYWIVSNLTKRDHIRMQSAGSTRTVSVNEWDFIFYNPSGAMNLTLPATTSVDEGFKIGAIVRGGAVTLTPDAADIIYGVTGTTAGATVSLSGTGNYIELISNNTPGGSNNSWVVTSTTGTPATP